MLSTLSIDAIRPQLKTTKSVSSSLSRKSLKFGVATGRLDLDPMDTLVASESPAKSVMFAEISLSTSSELSCPLSKEEHQKFDKIENLCHATHQCMEIMIYNRRCLGYLAGEARRLGVYLPQISQQSRQKQTNTCLARLLSSKQQFRNQYVATTGDLHLRRGDRLALALTVASSVLQLYKTPWLRE